VVRDNQGSIVSPEARADLKVYAVWPGNSIRGEVVALTYGDHWLTIEREKRWKHPGGGYYSIIHVFEVFKDPVKIHGKYGKRSFRRAGTYMGYGQWDSATTSYRDPINPHGKRIAKFDLHTEEMWYELIQDPLFHIRVGVL
jgi:hypothetical protein